MVKKKIIFFDFDGVIADSFSIAFEVNKIIDPNIVTEGDLRRLFDGNIGEWAKNSLEEEELDRITKKFFDLYVPKMKDVRIFSGIESVIARLAEKYTLFIISSTITSPIGDFMKRYNILSYFEELMGDNIVHTDKTGRIKRVFEKHKATPKDCVFITDTLGDMREAAFMGIQSIGVAWGFQKRENLLKGNPFGIAESPEDLFNIISDYFS